MGKARRGMISFRDLQNYTTLKHPFYFSTLDKCFRDLQNYTTLKQRVMEELSEQRFRDLQNYTTLKHVYYFRQWI